MNHLERSHLERSHLERAKWLALTLGSSIVFALALASAVSAQPPSGVVLDFTGPAGRQARAAVVQAADGVLALIPSREVESAAEAAGVSIDDHAGVVSVAGQLGLSLLIRGRVNGRGRRAMTQVRVLDAGGNDVAFREIAGDPRRGPGRRAIREGTREVLTQALTDLSARAAREEEAQQQAQAAHMAELSELSTTEDESDTGPRMPMLAARIGWGGRNRHAAVRLNPGTDKLYEASLFSELRLAVEARPFGGESSAAMRGLYASLDMRFSLGLSSQDATNGNSIDSQTFGLLLQAGWLGRLLEGDKLLLGGVVGFGYDSFSIDENSTLPSSAYPHLRFGVLSRMQILDELLTAQVDLGLRWVLAVGDFADAFGKDTGALGFDLGLRVGGSLDLGLNWAVRFAYVRYGLNFSGSVADPPAGCAMDPGCLIPVEAAGGSDSGLELALEAGWRFN